MLPSCPEFEMKERRKNIYKCIEKILLTHSLYLYCEIIDVLWAVCLIGNKPNLSPYVIFLTSWFMISSEINQQGCHFPTPQPYLRENYSFGNSEPGQNLAEVYSQTVINGRSCFFITTFFLML